MIVFQQIVEHSEFFEEVRDFRAGDAAHHRLVVFDAERQEFRLFLFHVQVPSVVCVGENDSIGLIGRQKLPYHRQSFCQINLSNIIKFC